MDNNLIKTPQESVSGELETDFVILVSVLVAVVILAIIILAKRKKRVTEKIVKDIMQRMKDQGMSQDDILKTIEKLSKQANED